MAEKQSRERIHATIVLLAAGNLDKLEHFAGVAEVEWRDVLFRSPLAHEDWPERLNEELGSRAGLAALSRASGPEAFAARC